MTQVNHKPSIIYYPYYIVGGKTVFSNYMYLVLMMVGGSVVAVALLVSDQLPDTWILRCYTMIFIFESIMGVISFFWL